MYKNNTLVLIQECGVGEGVETERGSQYFETQKREGS